MKTQPPGYRDFDKWCKTNAAMQRGLAAITSTIHKISHPLRPELRHVNDDTLQLYKNADFSWVPIVRVHDSSIPWLKSARLFPKAFGMQVLVHTREHPPVHIHVQFLDGEPVRLGWPSLKPLEWTMRINDAELFFRKIRWST